MWVRILGVVAAIAVTAALAASAYVLARPATTPPDVSGVPTVAPSEPVESQRPRPNRRKRQAQTATPTPSPTPSPTPQVAQPAPATQLGPAETRVAARLAKLIGRASIRDNIGLAVLNATGQPIYVHQASTPVIPASTQKLATASAALARFGPGHRYTTSVTTTAQPNARGVVRGDLVLVGGGDPALAQPAFAAIEPDRPRTRLEDLVRQVKRAGVRRITGKVLGDASIFAKEPVAVGWRARYFDQLDATRISGLTVDAGRRMYVKHGGLQADAAEDPAEQAAKVFRTLLRERGVKVEGKAAVTMSSPSGSTIATTSSPPLGVLLRYMVQDSDNHLADTIFRSLGAAAGDPTWIGAAAATADTLAPLQLDWGGVVLADGSGLSRANRVSASFLAQLQSRMMQSNLREQWVPLLAVTGNRGTLRSRLVGTVAQNRVYGKTGSLRDVSALVGTVAGTENRVVHFAIVGNSLTSTYRMRVVTDRTILAIAEEIQDCRRVSRPPKVTGKGKNKKVTPRPSRLVCG